MTNASTLRKTECGVEVNCHHSLSEIDKQEYLEFFSQSGASIFYHWNFLTAAEKHHLLPIEKTVYLVARHQGKLVAFLQVYLLPSADPFSVLSQTTKLPIGENTPGLFSHIMHFYESTVVVDKNYKHLYTEILVTLRDYALQHNIEFFGLINVLDKELLQAGKECGYLVNYMWDRFYIDFTPFGDMEDFLAYLKRPGRGEIRRQLRKFEKSPAVCRIHKIPFTKLEAVAELCFQTTSKNGTPQYYPPQVFKQFVAACGEWVRIFSIEQDDEILGVLVCFEEQNALHLWAGGMVYNKSEFSTYTMLFYHTYKYALENNINLIEAGRTNAKIKDRLGFVPKALYSIVSKS